MALALLCPVLSKNAPCPSYPDNCGSYWTLTCRVGEASNPGPQIAFSTLNVVSMSRNQDLLKEPTTIPTVNVYTETCLTKTVLPSVKAKTKGASRFLITGSMAAPRKIQDKLDSHARGNSGGVLIVSDLPSRPSSTPMDPPAWHSTRICEALVPFTPQITVRVVGFYGFPESSRRPVSHVELNNNLLSYVLKYVVRSTLPCLLMGDCNGDIEDLPFWQTLKTWGWKEVAVLQHNTDGKPIEPTWKATTRLDYILIPPQMLPFFHQYINNPDTISDHSRVTAVFDTPGPELMIRSWKKIRDSAQLTSVEPWAPEEYADIDWSPFSLLIEQKDVSGAYKIFCELFEKMITLRARRLSPQAQPGSFKGRARPKLVSQNVHQGRIPLARHGDYQPPLDDGPISARQHTRQIRRVQSATQQLRRSIGAPDGGSALTSARDTWEAVLHSAGYKPSFQHVCMMTYGISIPTTLGPEDLPILELLLQHLKADEPKWVARLQSLKSHTYKAIMNADWKAGGRLHHRAIKPPLKPEIAILEIPYPLDILRRRHSKAGPFWVTSSCDVPTGVTSLQFQDVRRNILELSGRNMRLDGPFQAASASITVIAHKPTSRVQDLHEMASSFWSAYWDSEDKADLDKLDELLQLAPDMPTFAGQITLDEIKSALKRSNPHKARGPEVGRWLSFAPFPSLSSMH